MPNRDHADLLQRSEVDGPGLVLDEPPLGHPVEFDAGEALLRNLSGFEVGCQLRFHRPPIHAQPARRFLIASRYSINLRRVTCEQAFGGELARSESVDEIFLRR